MESLKIDSLAFYDTFSGLIPCKVTGIETPRDKSGTLASSQDAVSIVLTASRAAYHKGERFTVSALHVVPRKAIHRRCGVRWIRPYTVTAAVEVVTP